MAGARVPLSEIARQVGVEPGTLRAQLATAGIEPERDNGPCVYVNVPIAPFLHDIDSVGSARKMSRDEISREILRVIFSGGVPAIEDVLERGAL